MRGGSAVVAPDRRIPSRRLYVFRQEPEGPRIEDELSTEDEDAAGAARLKDAVVAAAADGVIVFDRLMRIQVMRGEPFLRYGYVPAQLIGRPAAEVLPEHEWKDLAPLYARALAGETVTVDWDARERSEIFETTFAPIFDGAEIIGGIAAARDVTEPRRLRRELDSIREMLEVVFDSAPFGKFISRLYPDETTEIVECNQAFARMLGRTVEEIVGRSSTEFLHPDDLAQRDQLVRELLASGSGTVEARWLHSNGHEIWTQTSGAATTSPTGERLWIMQCVDISERKRLETRLRYVADHDQLTGLLTRRRFDRELERELGRARRHGLPATLMVLDLDGFKGINDNRGHAAGDQLLSEIADTLTGMLREEDILARIGGDEFAAILPHTDVASARLTATRLLGAIGGRRFDSVSASIGLTSLVAAPGVTSDQLLAQADAAMYAAKAAGKNQVRIHPAR